MSAVQFEHPEIGSCRAVGGIGESRYDESDFVDTEFIGGLVFLTDEMSALLVASQTLALHNHAKADARKLKTV